MKSIKKNKIHYTASLHDRWIVFEWTDWTKAYFAWWNESKPKFIIQSLVQLYWKEEWFDIYKKFCNWLLNIKNIKSPKDWVTTWALVIYKWDDNKTSEREISEVT